MNRFDLGDGPRRVRFTGTHLATVDADDGERIRWIELGLYKTQAGNYILYQVGRTVVYHLMNSDCKPKLYTAVEFGKLPAESAPCPVCQPPDDMYDVVSDTVQVRLESNLERVIVHETVASVIHGLENSKREGRKYLSRVARDLLVAASSKDEAIREAFLITEVA